MTATFSIIVFISESFELENAKQERKRDNLIYDEVV